MLFAGAASGVDLASSLSRFILPVAAIVAAAYLFRLFGFGWKIYRPSNTSGGINEKVGAYQRELDMIKGGHYLPYVEAMGEMVKESGGDVSAFERLRSEFTAIAGETGQGEASTRVDIDRIIEQMALIYKESTGDEGLSLSRRRR